MHLLLFTFLWLQSGPQPIQLTGTLTIRTDPGLRVDLDGKFVGVTNAPDGGIVLHHVAAGRHRITLHRDDYVDKTFDVEVAVGAPTEIKVSSLGWKRKNTLDTSDAPGALKIITAPDECVVTFNGEQFQKTGREIRFDKLAPGKYPISVKSGNKNLQRQITVQSGRRAIVQVDFTNNTVNIRDEALPIKMTVATDNALLDPSLPGAWAQALRSIIPSSGARVQQLAVVRGGVVMRVVTYSDGARQQLFYNLRKHPAIADSSYDDSSYSGATVTYRIFVKFRPNLQ